MANGQVHPALVMRPTAHALALAVLLVPMLAAAADFEPRAALGATYTDNIGETTDAAHSTVAIDANAGFSYLTHGEIVSIDADMAVLRREFLSGHFAPETLPGGHAALGVAIIPTTLTWVADDLAGQIEPRGVVGLVASDRESVNLARTGPDLHLRFGPQTDLFVSARYGVSRYSLSDIDGSNGALEGRLERRLSAASSIALVASGWESRYVRHDLYPNVRVLREYLGLQSRGARTDLYGEFGSESAELGSSDPRRTPHGMVGIARRVTARLDVVAEARHGWSDSAEALRRDPVTGFVSPFDHNIQPIAAPFLSDSFYVFAVRHHGRMRVALQGSFSRERYEFTPAAANLDRQIVDLDLVAEYRVSPSVRALASIRHESERFAYTDQLARRHLYSVGVRFSGGHSTSLSIAYERLGSPGGGGMAQFAEDRLLVSIAYLPGARSTSLFDPFKDFRYFTRYGVDDVPDGIGAPPN